MFMYLIRKRLSFSLPRMSSLGRCWHLPINTNIYYYSTMMIVSSSSLLPLSRSSSSSSTMILVPCQSKWGGTIMFPRNKLMVRTFSNSHLCASSKNTGTDMNTDGGKSSISINYIQEMKELEQERLELFGEFNDHHLDRNIRNTDTDTGTDENHRKINMMERNEERDLIYNFTQEEKIAWTHHNHIHQDDNYENHDDDMTKTPSSLSLKQVIAARNAYYESSSSKESSPYDPYSYATSSMTTKANTSFPNSNRLTHVNTKGDEINMVDVGNKTPTKRMAKARSIIYLPPEVIHALQEWNHPKDGKDDGTNMTEVMGTKGPIFHTARIAGIMAAKRTSDLIPLCHPLPLEQVQIDIQWPRKDGSSSSILSSSMSNTASSLSSSLSSHGNVIVIECTCSVTHTTGVEMEALMGANVAALTIYDMLKAVSHNIRIERTELVSKRGGKRDVGVDGFEENV